ncbi:MAG: DNA repair protein RecN [Desulfatiglandaceae bacterium]|jgi:DNA repair protein RecN (Recombination protein N)
MLLQLNISDFALIKHLDIAFQPGLNIISGETGAGKSIIINAMNLILGGRASGDLIRTGATEARVDALFSLLPEGHMAALLKKFDIPFDGELLIRRSLFRAGRNSISINGSIATLQMLSTLGDLLISISGQHEHQRLLKQDHHLSLLDDFGGLAPIRQAMAAVFNDHQAVFGKIRQLHEEITKVQERQELARFQMDEIERARILPDEDVLLDKEKKRLENAEELIETVSGVYHRLYEMEDSILSSIFECAKRLEKAAQIDDRLEEIAKAISHNRIRLEDHAMSLRDIQGTIEMDPGRLETVQERLELLTRLKRKYGPSLADVLAFREGLTTAMEDLDEKRGRLIDLEERLAFLEKEMKATALDLSAKRRKIAIGLEQEMEKELGDLSMPDTLFRVQFRNVDHPAPSPEEILPLLRSDGFDQVEFMLSPNVGEPLKPLAKIASGGELSRIMLALKSILARSGSVEAVIFDEVDAGIGGATAEVVGEKLQALARFHQILCITHLPQIASKAQTHFQVKKQVIDGRTQTLIAELTEKERVEEIARLLAGREITPQALAHAREMMR